MVIRKVDAVAQGATKAAARDELGLWKVLLGWHVGAGLSKLWNKDLEDTSNSLFGEFCISSQVDAVEDIILSKHAFLLINISEGANDIYGGKPA